MICHQITTRYISSIDCQPRRQDSLWKNWKFVCKCKRCSDPTECGSFVSAVKCFDCGADRVLPLDPLDYDSAWRCGRCGYSLGPRAVEQGGGWLMWLAARVQD